ncbi:MAG: hypothetical protein JWP03_4470 [Phycisphaerales bacterium]|nr:hypothetical protein [Phycisphaerales bacterium]
MWDCTVEILDAGRTHRFRPCRDGNPISYAEVLRLWREDRAFRAYFISLLADVPFAAYRWETPPISHANTNREFEFVLLESLALQRNPDTKAFVDYFQSTPREKQVVSFSNLGNDAALVVPCPLCPPTAYVHLAAFLRNAPEVQRHELWRTVGETAAARLSADPLWISTAGMGVAWLHVRLDSRPKYYGFAPFKTIE